jgi:hypothetical protein
MKTTHTMTREKHLDHLVRVVPILCLAYGIQSFMMMSYAQGGPTGKLVFLLGVSLALSVLGLVTYDLRHKVSWDAEGFSVGSPWYFKSHTIERSLIAQIDVTGAPEEFQTVRITLKDRRRFTFYFVDNGLEFKASMEEQTNTASHSHAA